jgi:hypothetical protein
LAQVFAIEGGLFLSALFFIFLSFHRFFFYSPRSAIQAPIYFARHLDSLFPAFRTYRGRRYLCPQRDLRKPLAFKYVCGVDESLMIAELKHYLDHP